MEGEYSMAENLKFLLNEVEKWRSWDHILSQERIDLVALIET